MSVTLILATLRQRFTSPPRLVFLLVVSWLPLIGVLVAPSTGFAALGESYWATLVLAAGMIGQDVASGTLQLLLARPVTRARYVFSRCGAAVLGTVLVVLLQIAFAALVMAGRGVRIPWGEIPIRLATQTTDALGIAAVMALFSALVPGFGDLGLLVLLFITGQLMNGVANWRGWGWLLRASGELLHFIKLHLDLAPFFGSGPVPWIEVVSFLSTVTLCLAVAIVVMNRKELSYASTGG